MDEWDLGSMPWDDGSGYSGSYDFSGGGDPNTGWDTSGWDDGSGGGYDYGDTGNGGWSDPGNGGQQDYGPGSEPGWGGGGSGNPDQGYDAGSGPSSSGGGFSGGGGGMNFPGQLPHFPTPGSTPTGSGGQPMAPNPFSSGPGGGSITLPDGRTIPTYGNGGPGGGGPGGSRSGGGPGGGGPGGGGSGPENADNVMMNPNMPFLMGMLGDAWNNSRNSDKYMDMANQAGPMFDPFGQDRPGYRDTLHDLASDPTMLRDTINQDPQYQAEKTLALDAADRTAGANHQAFGGGHSERSIQVAGRVADQAEQRILGNYANWGGANIGPETHANVYTQGMRSSIDAQNNSMAALTAALGQGWGMATRGGSQGGRPGNIIGDGAGSGFDQAAQQWGGWNPGSQGGGSTGSDWSNYGGGYTTEGDPGFTGPPTPYPGDTQNQGNYNQGSDFWAQMGYGT